MAIDAITEDTIRDALRALRRASPLRDSALLQLDLVSLGLRAEGLADTRQGRAWVLGRSLADAVEERLHRLRGGRPGPTAAELTPESEIEKLRQDLQAGHAERLDWALLHWRYLSSTRQPVHAVAAGLGMAERTIRYRLARGVEALTDALRESEVEAARSLGATEDAPLAERVIVDEHAPPRGVAELLGELQALASRHRQTIRISQAQLDAVARYPAAELVAYRLGRIAEWSLPRYQLDSRFVELSLLVDLGEESQSGRWKAKEERFTDLRAVLAAVGEPAVVLLGPPGSGKSTLLRRLELDLSRDVLGPGDPDEAAPLTFFISLNQYRPPAPGAPLPAPADWLADRWAARFPKLPPLPELARERPVVYLLDGLNEMPHRSPEEYRARIILWKQFLLDSVTSGSGHRAVIACRSLDYSAPLSTPALRVPQVQIERLSDAKVEEFLRRYSPGNAEVLWGALQGSALLEGVRTPYFLRLLVEEAVESADNRGLPEGLAALFTGFVRRALVREVERDNPRFAPGSLLSARDYERLAREQGWRGAYTLPGGGALFPALAGLAHGMQAEAVAGESSQARIGYAAALGLLPAEQAEDIVRAGVALGVLDLEPAADELQFSHQLLQEYFAGRALAEAPEPARVRAEWRAAKITPGVRELIETLPAAEALPPLPSTGWEETTLLAAAMVEQPEAFLRALMPHNLVLAGKAASLPAVRARLGERFVDELRWALVHRSRDPEADLRARIDAGLALGWLGDPRFERRMGPHGEYLLPPMVEIPGGVYPIGDDEPIEHYGQVLEDHIPCHTVLLAPFAIGRFAVTNAEWACFMAAAGYEDERWWKTPDALAWQRGEGTAMGVRANMRFQLAHLRDHPGLLEALHASGQWSEDEYQRYRRRLAMSESELSAHLREAYPAGRLWAPKSWQDERLNNPSQPVVGICWYEARAYCQWLSSQCRLDYRLPTEVEHEAAQRGLEARRWAFGNAFDPRMCNTAEARATRTTPIGVFLEGDTPEGVSDLCGNVIQWTLSLWGCSPLASDMRYPYDATDGREDTFADAGILRVARGSCWQSPRDTSRATDRNGLPPGHRDNAVGFRLCCTGGNSERLHS